MKKGKVFLRAMIVLYIVLSSNLCISQLLERNISLNVNRQSLSEVLEIMSNEGNFYFSYNSNIINRDSLVTVRVTGRPLKEILQQLLGTGFEFRESGNYIIIRRVPIKLRMITSSSESEAKWYEVTGYIIDDQTGEKITGASIYEKDRLVVSNTNAQGYFSIRLKSRYKKASVTVSKEYYADTTVKIESGMDQSLTITLVPLDISEHTVTIGPAFSAPQEIQLELPGKDSIHWRYTYVKKDSVVIEKTALGKWLVSSRAKLQSVNLKKFFVARPYQVSIVPGLSTNGKLNSQVINNFSLNLFGGYSGGTNGFELAGLFNIDRKDVQYVQVGGLLNAAGGHMHGLQVAGLTNTVLDSATGVQVGGLTNFVRRKVEGIQVAGIYNHAGESVSGVQVAGISNFAAKEMNGVQVAGIVNYTRRLKGVQVGLINIADTSEGYSIGLINIILKGYHKLSFSANEVMNMNASFKTGNAKLYSMILGGFNAAKNEKIWSFGYGLGSEFSIGNKFSINPEISTQHLYLGSWDYYNLQNKLNLLFNFKVSRRFSLYAGPSYSIFVSNQDVHFPGYKEQLVPAGYHIHRYSDKVSGWLGWTAGINIF